MNRPARPNLSDDPGLDLRRLGASIGDVLQGSVVHLLHGQGEVRRILERVLVITWPNRP